MPQAIHSSIARFRYQAASKLTAGSSTSECMSVRLETARAHVARVAQHDRRQRNFITRRFGARSRARVARQRIIGVSETVLVGLAERRADIGDGLRVVLAARPRRLEIALLIERQHIGLRLRHQHRSQRCLRRGCGRLFDGKCEDRLGRRARARSSRDTRNRYGQYAKKPAGDEAELLSLHGARRMIHGDRDTPLRPTQP